MTYYVIAGNDPRDPYTRDQPPPDLSALYVPRDLQGLRIGIFKFFFDDGDKEVVEMCWKTVEQFVARGATIVDIEIPELEEMRVALLLTAGSELSHAITPYGKEASELSTST